MSRDLSTTILIYASVDGRVRLTTKHGVIFDATLLRWEHGPMRAVIEPVGFKMMFDGFTAEVLRLDLKMLVGVGRAEGAIAAPDVELLRKAIDRPVELPPKSSAAAVKRAEKALADAATADEAAAAVQLAIDSGATRGLAAAVLRLDAGARARLALAATEAGAGGVLAALLADADLDKNWLLVRAAARGKIDAVAALLAAGADVDAVAAREPGAPYGRGEPHPALYHAVAHGHRAVVRRLLAAGARVTDSAGLAAAVVGEPDEVVWGLLLAAGLDVDARDRYGDPLLLLLGKNRQDRMVAATIAAGADVTATYPDGSTLLLHAIGLAMHEGASTGFIAALLKAGADPNAGRLGGRNPLALARVVPHDPGAHRGERWIARCLEQAGAVAVEEAQAAVIASAEPPAVPPWRARIDATLARAGHYEVAGIRFTPGPGATRTEMTPVATPRWNGLGCDDIATIRAKLEHLVGSPHDRGDNYKSTFEYWFVAAVDGASLQIHVCDWKADKVQVAIADHPDAALHGRVVAGFWELLTISPLAAFRDRFRFDDHAGRVYFSDGKTAYAK